MVRYNIRITYGDKETCKKFYFVHRDWDKLSEDEQNKLFNEAITELNRIYKDYGRFATTVGVSNLFSKYGFDISAP